MQRQFFAHCHWDGRSSSRAFDEALGAMSIFVSQNMAPKPKSWLKRKRQLCELRPAGVLNRTRRNVPGSPGPIPTGISVDWMLLRLRTAHGLLSKSAGDRFTNVKDVSFYDSHRLVTVSGAFHRSRSVAVLLPGVRPACSLQPGKAILVNLPPLLRSSPGTPRQSTDKEQANTQLALPGSRPRLPMQTRPASASGFRRFRDSRRVG
jgi:hypothetical protein